MTITPEHYKKLRRLVAMANFIEDLPHHKLHMPIWAAQDATEHSCGSAGCMLGWTVTKFPEHWYFYLVGELWVPRLRFGSRGRAMGDATQFFGITSGEAAALTAGVIDGDLPAIGLSKITPAIQAMRIRHVVRRYDLELVNITDRPADIRKPQEVLT